MLFRNGLEHRIFGVFNRRQSLNKKRPGKTSWSLLRAFLPCIRADDVGDPIQNIYGVFLDYSRFNFSVKRDFWFRSGFRETRVFVKIRPPWRVSERISLLTIAPQTAEGAEPVPREFALFSRIWCTTAAS